MTAQSIEGRTFKESDAYGELFGQVCCSWNESTHRMGGYPNFVQFRKLESSGPGTGDWLLLLQLDSEDDAGMMWGDLGKLYFTIRERDLRSLSFEHASLDWQCG